MNRRRDSIPRPRFKSISDDARAIGLYCFPQAIVPGDDGHWQKKPLVKWKALQERPPTDDELHAWCRRFPFAGAGIPTGPGTGILVVDADSADSIEWLECRGMPETWLVRSARGLHYYYRWPLAEYEIRNSAGEIAPGVDIRGYGGQVVASGTRRPDGFIYHWDAGHSPTDLPLADLPQWLFNALVAREKKKHSTTPCQPRSYGGRTSAWARKAFDKELAKLAATAEGSRNSTLWDVARRLGQLCAGGELDAVEVYAALSAIAASWPNLEHSRDTIRRAFEAGAANPKSAPSRFARCAA
jgi:Bifunctional DNA primase/polymerase, N-terminal